MKMKTHYLFALLLLATSCKNESVIRPGLTANHGNLSGPVVTLISPNSATPEKLAEAICENNRDINKVQKLIHALGHSINEKTAGETALTLASGRCVFVEAIKELILAKADLDIRSDNSKETALLQSLKEMQKAYSLDVWAEITSMLIQGGANIDLADGQGQTPLMLVNRLPLLQYTHGKTCSWSDYNQYYDYISPAKNKLKIFHEIMSKNPNLNLQDTEGNTALMYTELFNEASVTQVGVASSNDEGPCIASKWLTYDEINHYSSYEIAQILIKQGADLTLKNNKNFDSAYYLKYMAKDFIEKGYDLKLVQGPYNDTLLHLWANDCNFLTLVTESSDVDVNIQNNFGHSPLFYAKKDCSIDLLFKAGVNPNIQDKFGNTALMHYLSSTTYLSERRLKKMIEWSSKVKFNPDLQNQDGDSALILLAKTNSYYANFFESFVSTFSPNLNLKNNEGISALIQMVLEVNSIFIHQSCKSHELDWWTEIVAKIATNKNLDKNLKDSFNKTAYNYAISTYQGRVVWSASSKSLLRP